MSRQRYTQYVDMNEKQKVSERKRESERKRKRRETETVYERNDQVSRSADQLNPFCYGVHWVKLILTYMFVRN